MPAKFPGGQGLPDSGLRELFDAQTILQATSDDTPTALTIAEQRVVGRITGGNVTGLTAAQVRTLINVEDGATADQTSITMDANGLNMTSHGASGAPSSGTYAAGDIVLDDDGKLWSCTVGGTPGTWVSPSPGLTTAANWAALPGAPSDGDQAFVESSGLLVEYSSTYGLWFPAEWIDAITGYVADGSANDCTIDVVGGDDIATITGRGWAETGSATESAGSYIECNGDVFAFTPSAFASCIAAIQFAPQAVGGSNGQYGNYFGWLGPKDVRFSWSYSNTLNNLCEHSSTSTLRAHVNSVIADYEWVFIKIDTAGDVVMRAGDSPIQLAATYANYTAGGSTTINAGVYTTSSDTNRIRSVHVFAATF